MKPFQMFVRAANARHERLADMVDAGQIPPHALRTEMFPLYQLPEPSPKKKPSDTFRREVVKLDFHATTGAGPIGK